MGLYLVSGTPMFPATWRRIAIRAASEEEVQILINLVGDQGIFISSVLTHGATQGTRKDIQAIYGEDFHLPEQVGEVLEVLMSWSE